MPMYYDDMYVQGPTQGQRPGGVPPMRPSRPPVTPVPPIAPIPPRPPVTPVPPIAPIPPRPPRPPRPPQFPSFPIFIRPGVPCVWIDRFGRCCDRFGVCCDRNGWCCDQFGRCGFGRGSFGSFPAMAQQDDFMDMPVEWYMQDDDDEYFDN